MSHDRPDRHAGHGSKQLTAAGIACGISLCLHLVAALFVARVVIVPTRQGRQQEAPKRRYEAVDISDLSVAEAVRDKVLDELRASGAVAVTDLPEQIERLAPAPDETALTPPELADASVLGSEAAIAEPSALPARAAWQALQEIIAIEDLAVAEEIPGLERRHIPTVERLAAAPGLATAGFPDADMVASLSSPLTQGQPLPPSLGVPGGSLPPLGPLGAMPDIAPIPDEAVPGEGRELFEETPDEITEVKPIEAMLTYSISTYSSLRDFRYGYFRLEIERIGDDVLPVMPKDIIFVQDCSKSMAEQRLYFCRKGLIESLGLIGPGDRFNVAQFKENVTTCFPGWVEPSEANKRKATGFIGAMQADGNTDIYTSMHDLLKQPRQKGRPVVAIVITDGLANTGRTGSSDIIGAFSQANDGAISVFTMGTVKQANTYLLDLLSYCNRGDVHVVTGGRWDIPEAVEMITRSVSRPVLGDLRMHFATDTPCEVYPLQTSNLYLDRKLVLYGRYPKGQDRIVFQAVGEKDDAQCDMLFDASLGKATAVRDDSIRDEWARQKIYHLIGEYARTPRPAIREELKKTRSKYGGSIPYRADLGF